MSTLKVQKVDHKKSFDWGNVYAVIGELDGELETVEIGAKEANAPKVGDILEGTVEDGPYGKKFKKDRPLGFAGRSGGFAPRPEDPEKQKMIVRQNALGNAVTFQAELAKLKKDGDLFTTDNVIMVAQKFARFSLGESTVIEALDVRESDLAQMIPDEDQGAFSEDNHG